MNASADETQLLQSLLQRAGAGDAEAFGQLLERAAQRLQQMARRMLRNYSRLRRWEETDDVFQSAMMRLQRALSEVKPSTARGFYGLAATQIRRVLIDLVRHHFGPEGSAAHHDSDLASRPSAGVLQQQKDRGGEPETLEEWAAFHEAVQRLPDPEREVFDLLWYGDMRQMEAAQLLGVSVPTIQRRWHRARTLLYEALQGESLLEQGK